MSHNLYLEIDTGGEEMYVVESFGITSNLSRMADELGIYEHLWKSKEGTTAGELAAALGPAIEELRSRNKYFSQFDAENGWGTSTQFLDWLIEVRESCLEHPKCVINGV